MTRSPYPDYDVRTKWDTPSWNAQTRKVMSHRLHAVPPRCFLDEAAFAVLEALCACVVPRPRGTEAVPIAPWIDAELSAGRGTGTRYATLPADGQAWRQGLKLIDAEAWAREGRSFAALDAPAQEAVLRAIDAGETRAQGINLPPRDFLRKLAFKRIVEIYYAHPAAMSEIGFGGPASPRGYVRLGGNRTDPWEAPAGRWER